MVIFNAADAVPSCFAVASDIVRQQPVADADAAAAEDIGNVVPAHVSCYSLAASVLGCAPCLAVVPSEHVRSLPVTRRLSHRPLHSHCQSLVRER